MTTERPAYFPELPTPWPRLPDYVPGSVPVDTTASGAVLWEQAAAPPPPAPELPATPEPRRRVELSGNIGREPIFGRTPKG